MIPSANASRVDHDVVHPPPTQTARTFRAPCSVSSDYGVADYFFDAVRVTWVVAVLLILMVDMDMGQAFLIGGYGVTQVHLLSHTCCASVHLLTQPAA